jgi:hypothetical protein
LSVECLCLDVQAVDQLADHLSLQEPTYTRHGNGHVSLEAKDGRSLSRGQCELAGPVEPNRVELCFVAKLTRTCGRVNSNLLQPREGSGTGQKTKDGVVAAVDGVPKPNYGPRSVLVRLEYLGLTDIRKLKRNVEARIGEEASYGPL